jgi:hypothetical protein
MSGTSAEFHVGNMVVSFWMLVILPSSSHCSLKCATVSCARGSASMRITCALTWSRVVKAPASAAAMSASSGMVLQRRYDKRVAISYESSGASVELSDAGGIASSMR